MTILIVGGGAVGSLLAWALQTGGLDVFMVRRGTVSGPGSVKVVVVDPGGTRRSAEVALLGHPAEAPGRPDAIVLAVKMYDLAAAVASCQAWPEAPVVTVQNGIGAEEMVAAGRGDGGIVAASLTAAVEPSGQGDLLWLTRGGLALAPFRGSVAATIPGLAAAVEAAGLPARALPDAAAMKWSKLLGNLVANASAAILDMEVGAIYRNPGLFRLERDQIHEALAVMRRLSLQPIPLPGADVRLLVRAFRLPAIVARPLLGRVLAGARGGKDPSLLIHARSRRGDAPSEVQWLNGAVVRAGEAVDVPTPVNRRLTELVEEVLRDPGRRDWFRGRPDRLVAAVREPAL
jgi:2-dehydropantoate 2-reductase